MPIYKTPEKTPALRGVDSNVMDMSDGCKTDAFLPDTLPFSPIKPLKGLHLSRSTSIMEEPESSVSSETATDIDLYDGETVDEILELSTEVGLNLLDNISACRRMNEGYWDSEDAKKCFIASRLETSLQEIKILMRNLCDARVKMLGGSQISDLRKQFEDKEYVQADFYMEDEDGMSHHEIFKTAVSHKNLKPKKCSL